MPASDAATRTSSVPLPRANPVQRRPPVLPGPTPRDDDATSTAPVSGRTAATTESRVVREARNYADPDILEPRWLRVSDTPFDAPYKATKGYGRQMHPTTVSYLSLIHI